VFREERRGRNYDKYILRTRVTYEARITKVIRKQTIIPFHTGLYNNK
jgi:hypothetical protein